MEHVCVILLLVTERVQVHALVCLTSHLGSPSTHKATLCIISDQNVQQEVCFVGVDMRLLWDLEP